MTELERLTKRIESAMYWGADTPEKIAERLIDEGVICPPCKVGDTVYRLHFNTICNVGYEFLHNSGCQSPLACYDCPQGRDTSTVKEDTFRLIDLNQLDKTVFLSREEAEAALAERRKA